ncbi:hypothetical protein bpr_II224 (plasmid) [Butyrivibrio proteoclasticus B316]|uniref:Uncharacterized protein n=1 Tax=Butyrivibrio proteoclasticus (strain ATCC 51982 / DSM 14932 / B316) TaxID=515622 RepID=E0S429_BUTPB|nr:hypothetical protein [Butyrivibrio proteoclasticus]ADL36161.1 hypothetical protein bpr_II224 [Butyrivibrio proteoclasticus B316]
MPFYWKMLGHSSSKYIDIALDAFETRQNIEAVESGGIAPCVASVEKTEAFRCGDSVKVVITFLYESTCGLSDVTYHVKERRQTETYEFKNGEMTCGEKPLFDKPFVSQSRNMQMDFFKRHADMLTVVSTVA